MSTSPIERLVFAAVLPLWLLMVAPLTFYLGNAGEMQFGLHELVWPVSAIFIASVCIIFVFLTLLIAVPAAYRTLAGILIGLAYCAWAQSQLLVWDLGALDGRGVDWEKWQYHAYAEMVVWGLILLGACYLFLKNEQRVIRAATQIIYLLVCISLASLVVTMDKPAEGRGEDGAVALAELFRFHPTNNTLVIVLDTFQSDYFELVRTQYPGDVEFLEGFTFYRNTVSNFPGTRASLPTYLTGQIYDNQLAFSEFETRAFEKYDLRRAYEKDGYGTAAISNSAIPPNGVSMEDVLTGLGARIVAPWRYFVDYGLFRAAPTLLKPVIYNESSWLFAFLGRKDYPPERHGVDIHFLELFEKRASVHRESDLEGAFKYLHFFTPHPPYRVTNELMYQEHPQDEQGYISQVRGALHIARRILKEIRKLGLYHDMEIVIMADHGTLAIPPRSRAGLGKDSVSFVPDRVQSSALAMLLYKKPGASGPLTIDDTELMLADLPCLLGRTEGALACSEADLRSNAADRVRIFRFYDVSRGVWGLEFFPSITEYEITGHAYDAGSWRVGEKVFEQGRVVVSPRQSAAYRLGQEILFAEAAPPDRYLLNGWSMQEKGHRWTDGKFAGVRFVLDAVPQRELEFRLRGQGYYPQENADAQDVVVSVNGQTVAELNMKTDAWYSVRIPRSLVGSDGIIQIVFEIQNPASPADYGGGDSRRMLGFAARAMSLDIVDDDHAK